MTGEKTAKKDRDPIFTICLGIFLIAAIIAVGAFINNEYLATGDEKASTGDKVTVDYTGTYYAAYGEENAVVFDTSYSSVAKDDDIAKSNDFTTRSSYSPLEFEIGKKTMLEDFENAVVGLKVGEETKIVIDAAHGYVASSTTGKLTKTGNEMDSVLEMTYDEFHTAYPDVSISGTQGTIKFESKFKWDAYAMLTDNGKKVMVTYAPVAGDSYTVYENGNTKVTYKVTAVGDGKITYDIDIVNPVKVNDGGDIQMIKLDLGDKIIYITNISGDDITYKEGAERVNQQLFFVIKLVSIE